MTKQLLKEAKTAFNAKTYKELSKAIGINLATIKKWSSNNSISNVGEVMLKFAIENQKLKAINLADGACGD